MKIEQLKDLGHNLIEEYMTLLKNNGSTFSKRERTYNELQQCMKGKNSHFGSMKNKNEVMFAIGTLKKMIYRKQI